MNKYIPVKENKPIVNNLSKQKDLGPVWFPGEFYQKIKKINYANSLQSIVAEGIPPNSLYEDSIILIPKPDKDIYKERKLQTNICHKH